MDFDFDLTELAGCSTAAPFLCDPDELHITYPNKPINLSPATAPLQPVRQPIRHIAQQSA